VEAGDWELMPITDDRSIFGLLNTIKVKGLEEVTHQKEIHTRNELLMLHIHKS